MNIITLHYAKFDVSRLFCSKVIEEKPLGLARPSLVKEALIPADVTDVHKMFRFARSKPDWCTELGKAFTMAG